MRWSRLIFEDLLQFYASRLASWHADDMGGDMAQYGVRRPSIIIGISYLVILKSRIMQAGAVARAVRGSLDVSDMG